jgi:hypothetical protein
MCKIVYICVNKYFIVRVIVILYDATMHKTILVRSIASILIRIVMKFISPFSEQDCIFYKFLNLKLFSGI